MKGFYRTHADHSHGSFFREKAVAGQVRFLEFQLECKWEQNGKRLINFSEESLYPSLWAVNAWNITWIKEHFGAYYNFSLKRGAQLTHNPHSEQRAAYSEV